MKRKLGLFLSSLLAITSLSAFTALPAQAAGIPILPNSFSETRPLTVGTSFTPEANDTSLDATVYLQIAQATMTGATTDVYRVRGKLKEGGTVISLERNVIFSSDFNQVSGSNKASPKNATAISFTELSFKLASRMTQGETYVIETELYKNGQLLTLGTDYSATSVSGKFSLAGNTSTPDGDESGYSFSGDVCVAASALSGVAVGDQLELTIADSSQRSYSVNSVDFSNSAYSSPGARYANPVIVVAGDLVSGMRVYYSASVSASGAGVYDPKVSITKVGSTTELASNCLSAPSAAPTLTATATGITMAVTVADGQEARCYLAQEDSPNVIVAESGYYGNMNMGPFSVASTPSCFFDGLKRDSYVGWYELWGDFYLSTSEDYGDIRGYSAKSPTSTAVAYTGGNGSFPTYTNNAGGTGQGSLQVTTVANDYFDYGTAGSRYTGNGYGRSSDGNGGLLISSIEAPTNELSLRRLISTGQDMTFAGDGTAEVTFAQPGRYTRTAQVGWYGAQRDKWIVMMQPSYSYGPYLEDQTVEVILGDYSSGQTSATLLSEADIREFCGVAVSPSLRQNYSGAYIQRILPMPSANPTLLINCNVRLQNQSGTFYSSLYFIAEINAQGALELRNALGAEPTDAEPCSRTIVSEANSGATGSDVLIASYQVSFLPSGGGCYPWDVENDPSLVTGRDLYRILANTQTVSVSPDTDVLTNTGSREPLPDSSSQPNIVVSGPNIFFVGRSVAGQWPDTTTQFRIAMLSQGTFGEYTTMPTVKVNGEDSFTGWTSLRQIPDFSENDATSVLLLRTDEGGSDSGTTASRVTVSDGTAVTYRQMVTSSSGADGFSTAVGSPSGDLNFYGIASRTEAVVGQWVTTGTLDPELASLPVNQGAANTGVSAPSMGPGPNPTPPSSSNNSVPAPFPGPTLTSGRVEAVSGKSAKLSGANLNDVSKIMIGEIEIEFELSEDGDINLKVPANLEAGVYDLTVSYSGGTVVMQGALSVTSSTDEPGEARPSTKRGDDDTVKVRVFDVVNAGKVQIFVNDKEIVWIRATDFDDPKLSAFGYLVRTIMLQPGKNVIEVYVDGNRVDRKAYTLFGSNSNNN